MGRLFPFFLIFVFVLRVFPQHLGGIPKFYTPNEGISNGFTRGITQDNLGFIWIATDEGLNRFDGLHFTTFFHNLNNSNALSSNKLAGIRKDAFGKLWIGIFDQPVIDVLDPVTLVFKKITLDFPSKAKSPILNFIYTTGNGFVFLHYRGESSVVKIDAKKHSVEYLEVPLINSPALENIEYITETASSDVIIATSQGRVFLLETGKAGFQLIQDFNEQVILSQPVKGNIAPVYAITASMSGWSYNESARVFSPVKGSQPYIAGLNTQKFHSLFADSDGNLWINRGYQEISFVPSVNGQADFSKVTVHKLLPIEIKSFFIDYENNIWLGSVGYGTVIYPDKYKKFTNFSHAKEYPQKEGVRSLRFILKKNDKTYIAGYDGLQILDKNNHFEQLLYPGTPIRSAIFSTWGGKEIIWLGPLSDQTDIFWYDINSGQKGSVGLTKLPLARISYYDIFEENEFLWFSTNKGIIRYDRLNRQMSYYSHQPDNPASLPADQVRLVRKIQGKFVAAVIENGMWEIDAESGTTKPFTLDDYTGESLPKEMIISAITDAKGDHWLGTNGEGLFHLDHQKKSVNRYFTGNGLHNNTVYTVLIDNKDDIWGATNQGIFRFERDKKRFYRYDKSDGLIENEFNAGAAFADNDGTLFFGSINGFSSFKPEDIRINLIPPKMALLNLTVNNIDYTKVFSESVNGRITLPHDSNYISISFTSLTFNGSLHARFAYKIEGIHSEYINLESTRILQLNGLDEGVYHVSITGTNGDGRWAEVPLKLTIVITPSFAESWVFYFIIFIVFVLTAITWADWREKRLTKQKEELENAVRERTRALEVQNSEIAELNNELRTALTVKNKFLSIVAHDLKAPFTALLGYSEILSEDLDTLPKEQVTMMVNELGRLSQQTYGLISNLLNWTQLQTNRITLSPVKTKLKEAVAHCSDILQSGLKKKQITLINEVTDDIIVYADRNMVNTVLLNLINNAYKFTNPGGEIRVISRKTGNKVNVMVADNGIGMDEEKISTLFSEEKNESNSGTLGEKGTGLGLLLIKELLDFAGESITVESEPDKGTKITFTLDIYEKE